jgi:negative regulator of flagellin synthesis FlgM
MKINQVNPISRIGAAYQAYQKSSEHQKKVNGEKPSQSEKVEISTEAQMHLQLEKDARIEKLKNQIANGTYRVDSEKVAEKLLAYWKSGANIDE